MTALGTYLFCIFITTRHLAKIVTPPHHSCYQTNSAIHAFRLLCPTIVVRFCRIHLSSPEPSSSYHHPLSSLASFSTVNKRAVVAASIDAGYSDQQSNSRHLSKTSIIITDVGFRGTRHQLQLRTKPVGTV